MQKGISTIRIFVILALVVLAGSAGYVYLQPKQETSKPFESKPAIETKIPQSSLDLAPSDETAKPRGTRTFYNSVYQEPQGQLLKANEVAFVEGVVWKEPGKDHIRIAELPYNAICFASSINVAEDSIIKAKVKVKTPKEFVCSDAEILEFETQYSEEEIKSILGEFASLCLQIENDVNTKKLTQYPIKMTCRAFDREMTSRFDYGWIPSKSKLLVHLLGSGQEQDSGGCFKTSTVDASVLVNLKARIVEEIHILPSEGKICR